MNIRKFVAPTARQALRDIRNELGDEAVILSNRKVDEVVEIIALANEEQLSGVRDQGAGIRNQESGVGRVSTRQLRQAQDRHVGLKPDPPATVPPPPILN